MPAEPAFETISSPCIGVCTLDESRGLCIGCFRTTSEIGAWSQLSESQRQEIMKQLDDRMEQLFS